MFKSSEIRWFSQEREFLWDFYDNLPEKGMGYREIERTDYYLKSGTENTGIKVREGNHELKVKSAEDEKFEYGTLTHWIKWSVAEKNTILNTIDEEMLEEWEPVKKSRFKKTYEIAGDTGIHFVDEAHAKEGVEVEFTEVYFKTADQLFYTVGFESFSAVNRQRENLLQALNMFDTGHSAFRNLDSYGYPKLLKNLGLS